MSMNSGSLAKATGAAAIRYSVAYYYQDYVPRDAAVSSLVLGGLDLASDPILSFIPPSAGQFFAWMGEYARDGIISLISSVITTMYFRSQGEQLGLMFLLKEFLFCLGSSVTANAVVPKLMMMVPSQ